MTPTAERDAHQLCEELHGEGMRRVGFKNEFKVVNPAPVASGEQGEGGR